MNSKLMEQRSVIKCLLLEDENLAKFFKGCIFSLKPTYPLQTFTAGFHSLSSGGRGAGGWGGGRGDRTS